MPLDLIDHEILSALRGLALGRHLSDARAQDALTDYDDLAIRRHPSTAAMRAPADTSPSRSPDYPADTPAPGVAPEPGSSPPQVRRVSRIQNSANSAISYHSTVRTA